MRKTCVILGWLLAAAAGPLSAQETFRLVSAQVVTATDRPSTLKLSASGPIAFAVVAPEATGQTVAANQLTARLYGVTPGDLAAPAGLAPFAVSLRADGHDTVLTVSASGNVRLAIRAAMKANEIEVVATAVE